MSKSIKNKSIKLNKSVKNKKKKYKKEYVIAIPSYNRPNEIKEKTLTTLLQGGVSHDKIHIFVANKEQKRIYESTIPRDMYHTIVVGSLGIANQRNFISQFFPEGQHIVSIDDDVQAIKIRESKSKLRTLSGQEIDDFFKKSFYILQDKKLFMWGIYPVTNSGFMSDTVTTGLQFIIGVLFGYINRHRPNLKISPLSESKDDYHNSILYFLQDGGTVRFNYLTTQTKFAAKGGLGEGERRDAMNRAAANFLVEKYPDLVFYKKGTDLQIRLTRTKNK